MKTLYHGSLEIVEKPQILPSNRTLDFGKGFYTTTNFEQAKRWVEIKKAERKSKKGYVCVYEIDDNFLQNIDFKILIFEKTSEEWIDFIIKNRTDIDFIHKFDIVFGPVANDNVYRSLTLFESRFINKKELIKELKAYRLVDQALFHTEKAINLLNYKENIEI